MTTPPALLAVALGIAAAVGCGDPAAPKQGGAPAQAPSLVLPQAEDPAVAPPPEPAAPPAQKRLADEAPLKVLLVEGSPRWEYVYLSNALAKDRSMHLWAWLADDDPDAPMKTSPGLPQIDTRAAFASREALAAYDVLVLGDVSLRDLATTTTDAARVTASVREFVAEGGGLVVIAGFGNMPSKLAGTALEDVMPVVFDPSQPEAPKADEPSATEDGAAHKSHLSAGFDFRVTPDGERSRMLDIAGDPAASKALWEVSPKWRQYWRFDVKGVRPGAQILLEAVPPGGDETTRTPVVVTGTFGKGRVVFVGVDDLWRIRYDVGDRYFWQFWKAAIRWAAAR